VQNSIDEMVAAGYDKGQVAALAKLVESMREDIKEEYQQAEGQKAVQNLDQRCWDAMESALEGFEEQYPELKWSKTEIGQRAWQSLQKDDAFSDARAAYTRGQVPAKDIRAAISKNVRTWLKETGRNKSNGTPSKSLDVRSSKAKPGRSKDPSSFDESRLTAAEKRIYTITLNACGDKNLAIRAVKRLGKAGVVED
jgi:hypothetical protein